MNTNLILEKPEWIIIILHKIDRLTDCCREKIDFPSQLTFVRHYSAFRTCGKPNGIGFVNGVKIYINLDWNIENYLKQIVPEHFHQDIRSLIKQVKNLHL